MESRVGKALEGGPRRGKVEGGGGTEMEGGRSKSRRGAETEGRGEEEEGRRAERKEEADKKAEERRHQEAEEQKRAEGERKQREEEEEHRRHLEVEKEKQSETVRQEDGESGKNLVEEVEVQLCEQQVSEQMARVAHAESSKQATRDFAQAALAHWRSRGMTGFNRPYVDVGPIGTHRHISLSCLLSHSSTNVL